jgi:hypothetical protein
LTAWAGRKNFQPPGGGSKRPPDDPGKPTVDFTGQKPSNEMHVSWTDLEARLYRKSFGIESRFCYAEHILMDNRHGLAVDVCLSEAKGRGARSQESKPAFRWRLEHRICPPRPFRLRGGSGMRRSS